MHKDLTQGSILKTLMGFSIPFLVSSFLQTFYGMADLFITGQFNGAAAVTAVSMGSQVMHMLTVVIVGLAMGTTVSISRSIGEKRMDQVSRFIGNSVTLFLVFAAVLTTVLLLGTGGILFIMATPHEAMEQAYSYLMICFIGVPFITAYNVIGSIFRGLGDTKSPMIFVAIAGVINVGLDYLLIGPFDMGAAGAAIATVTSQAFSVIISFLFLKKRNTDLGLSKGDLRPEGQTMRQLLGIGGPIAIQESLIQISFLTITAIANSRGVDVAAAVGITEKIISFLFLVPSAMLSSISAVAAQNAGAGLHERGRKTLFYGMAVCVIFGVIASLIVQLAAGNIISLFVKNEPEVVRLGEQYFRVYVFDCVFAGMHFCFSGYFSAYGKSMYSFLHNIISTVTIRVPGAYLASVLFPLTLYQMGAAAPLGSLLSAVICVFFYRRLRRETLKNITG